MLQDIRVAWRFLRKGGISTALAAFTLGITVAMCSVAAGVLDDTFWRPLRFENGDRLVTILNSRDSAPQFQVLSYSDYADVRDRLATTVDVAAFVRIFQTVGGGGAPMRVQGELVSGNYFAVLHARPFIGRLFTQADDRIPSGHPIVVLEYDFWRQHFGADRAVVGRPIRLNRQTYTVIGIASQSFHGPTYQSQFWIPLMMARQAFGGVDVLSRADIPLLQTVASPLPGVSLEQVRSRVQGIETSASRDEWRLTALPGVQLRFWPGHRHAVIQFLGIFAALGVCVLMIGCANIAGLLIARNGERQRDLAIRQSLGAKPGHLLRRLAAESIVLTTVGGAIGLAFTFWTATLLERIAVPAPIQIGLTVSFRLIFIAIAISLGASLLVTAVFAAKALGSDIRGVLAFFSTAVAAKSRMQRALVVAQIATSCVCLIAAGLFLRTAIAAAQIDPGFAVANTVTGMISLGDQGYTPETGTAFYERLQENLENTANVQAAAIAWHEPLGVIRAIGRFSSDSDWTLSARYNVVGRAYFSALHIPVLSGREFERRDRSTGEPVAIVNQTMAARLGSAPIGKTLRFGADRLPRRVVGVVRDVKDNGITEAAQPYVYLPLSQEFRRDVWVHVRTQAAAAEVILRSNVGVVDSNVAVSDIHTFSEQLDEALATQRISARISGAMASIAVFLAIVGVYGVLTASVDQRKRELSIRTALGAAPRDLLHLIMLDGVWLTVIGLITGMVGSFAGSGLLAALLYGVEPRDPLVFAIVPVAIFVVSMAAAVAPARRAARADPAATLKAS